MPRMPGRSLFAFACLLLLSGIPTGCAQITPDKSTEPAIRGDALSLPASAPYTLLLEACEPTGSPPPAFSDFQDCYSHQLEQILVTQGATLSMLTLYQLAEASKRFGNLCHATAHHISEIMFERVGSVTEAMALCREGCAYGCQHAVLTAYLRSLPSGAQPDLERLCPQNPQHLFSLSHSHCIHGIGHGLAHYLDDIQLALAVCDKFSLAWEQHFCAKGVFMEHSNKVALTQPPSKDHDRHLSLCRTMKSRVRNVCYYYLIQLVTLAGDGTTRSMFAACKNVPTANRGSCFLGIGRSLTNEYIEREDDLIRLCRTQEEEDAASCLLGFAGVVASFVDVDRGFRFCARLPENVRIRCTRDVGIAVRLHWAAEDRITSECRKARAARYVDACLGVYLPSGELATQVP